MSLLLKQLGINPNKKLFCLSNVDISGQLLTNKLR